MITVLPSASIKNETVKNKNEAIFTQQIGRTCKYTRGGSTTGIQRVLWLYETPSICDERHRQNKLLLTFC